MRVAIIGAGLAGLSCAIVLESHGIIPDVYEKLGYIGDREQHASALLHVMNKPMRDELKFMKNHFGISLTPINTVNILTHHSPTNTTVIKGDFGYFFGRGIEKYSLKSQLYSQLKKTKVNLNQEANYKDLRNEYDFVVVADGKPDVAEELGSWSDWISGYIKGAVVEGSFNPTDLVMWLNKDYCKNGYAYLTPFNCDKASLALYVPYTDVNDIDYFWDKFLAQENIKSDILETFKVFHTSGYAYPIKCGNVLLAGNAGGAIDPFLGFGQSKAIFMGGMAAKAIVNGVEYEKLAKPIYKQVMSLYEFRRAFDKLNNKSYDRIVKSIGIPGVKPIVYDSPINVISAGAALLKAKRMLTGDR